VNRGGRRLNSDAPKRFPSKGRLLMSISHGFTRGRTPRCSEYGGSTMKTEELTGCFETRPTTPPPVSTSRHSLGRRNDQGGGGTPRPQCHRAHHPQRMREGETVACRPNGFVLDEKQRRAFMAALDRPAQAKPRLRQPFKERQVAKRRS